MRSLELPLYPRHRSPGSWPWEDFRDAAEYRDYCTLPPAPIHDCATYSERLFKGWKTDRAYAMKDIWHPTDKHAMVKKLSTPPEVLKLCEDDIKIVTKIHVGDRGTLNPCSSDFSKEKAPAGLETLFGKILFFDDFDRLKTEELGRKFHVNLDYFRACFDQIVSHNVDIVSHDGDKFEDHTRITLPFLRAKDRSHKIEPWMGSASDPFDALSFDLLGIYMIRSRSHNLVLALCCALDTHSRSKSSYRDMFQWTTDTGGDTLQGFIDDARILLVPIFWYVVYAWYDAIGKLYAYLDALQAAVLESPSVRLTQRFHTIRIHLSNYKSLLQDFSKTINFIVASNNLKPVKEDSNTDKKFQFECKTMLSEIEKLTESISNRDDQIKYITDMVFSHVTIRDSAAMKQISWVTTFFIPATFVAGVFGMNVTGIGQGVTEISTFVATAIPFTVVTIWILGALLPESGIERPLKERLLWPFNLCVEGMRQLGPRREEPSGV